MRRLAPILPGCSTDEGKASSQEIGRHEAQRLYTLSLLAESQDEMGSAVDEQPSSCNFAEWPFYRGADASEFPSCFFVIDPFAR